METQAFERLIAGYAFFFVVIAFLVVFLKIKPEADVNIDGTPVNRHPLFRLVMGSVAFGATLVQVFVAGHIREPGIVIFAILSAIACWLIWLSAFSRLIKDELGD